MIEADYTFYRDTYKGSLDYTAFQRLITRAVIEVDNMTFGRARSVTDAETVNRVKLAECAVIDELAHSENGIVVSATNDGYSESYQNTRNAGQRIKDAASCYLALTGLLYCGGLPRC